IFYARYSGLTKASATARFAAVGARLFVGGKQAAGTRLQFADAGLRIGMRRQPLRWAAAAGADHVLPQAHCRARVEAGLGHELLADHVGLGFLVARVGQKEEALRRDAAELCGRVRGALAVLRADQFA